MADTNVAAVPDVTRSKVVNGHSESPVAKEKVLKNGESESSSLQLNGSMSEDDAGSDKKDSKGVNDCDIKSGDSSLKSLDDDSSKKKESLEDCPKDGNHKVSENGEDVRELSEENNSKEDVNSDSIKNGKDANCDKSEANDIGEDVEKKTSETKESIDDKDVDKSEGKDDKTNVNNVESVKVKKESIKDADTEEMDVTESEAASESNDTDKISKESEKSDSTDKEIKLEEMDVDISKDDDKSKESESGTKAEITPIKSNAPPPPARRLTRSATKPKAPPAKAKSIYDESADDFEEDEVSICAVKKKSKDEGSDIEMIEESDPLAISEADVQKAKEIKHKKESSVILVEHVTPTHPKRAMPVVHSRNAAVMQQTNNIPSVQSAIQQITGGNPAIQGLQAAYLSAIQQVLVAQGAGQVSNPHYLSQLQQYYNTLGALQDDAYVIEAPSFIVPYVMEGKPVESIKDYITRVTKEDDELKKKLEKEGKSEKGDDEKKKEGSVEKDDSKSEKSANEDIDKDKEDKSETKDKTAEAEKDKESEMEKDEKAEVEKDEKAEVEKDKKADAEKDEKAEVEKDKKADAEKDEKAEEKVDENEESKKGENEELKKDEKAEVKADEKDESKKDDEIMEVDVVKKDDKEDVKDDKEKSEDTEKAKSEADVAKDADSKTSEEVKETTKDEKEKDVKEVEIENLSHLGRWETYYKSTLGKFFLELGLNQAKAFIQADLLKMQKKKVDKMKTQPSRTEIHIVKSLETQLAFSRKKNAHLALPLICCKYCTYKSESQMVMERHLESPHMTNYTYKCNFCSFETRGPQVILFHTEAEHNVRGRLERAPAFFQCPMCPWEDNNKAKMTRHSVSCAKKFKPEKNSELIDWEPPAKIPKVNRGRSGLGKTFEGLKMPILPKSLGALNLNLTALSNTLIAQNQANSLAGRGRGRPVGSYKGLPGQVGGRGGLMYQTRSPSQVLQNLTSGNSNLSAQISASNRIPRILPASGNTNIIAGLSPSSSITIQSVGNKIGSTKSPQQPSISITPLPRGGGQASTLKPGISNGRDASGNRPSFVICEICDGYIKDLEQLRNHMNWIHKVKIHPKMIYNRPPLNCQKCQHRFFTDQGLERHLLGTHGLVTSSMQEAANKGKDAGRCPICGKVFQWKLLNHVSRDHKMTLKPAHLSYKCTVCTATFNMYRLFENHVYSAHSVVNKNKGGGEASGSGSSSSVNTAKKSIEPPLKINDEITIIPQPSKSSKDIESKLMSTPNVSKEITITKVGTTQSLKRSGVEVISLDDSPSKKDDSSKTLEPPKKRPRDTATSRRARTST